jgi:undecaprenyl-diphosphatase
LDHPSAFVALILGIVEGLTEFLPVSSTGHLIVAGSLLGYTGERAKVFEIVIQAGAILAVCWEYRARLVSAVAGLGTDRVAQRFVANLVIAFIPAAVLGLLFASAIKRHLFAPLPVAMAFIVGALVILWVERRRRAGTSTARIDDVDDMRWPDALKIGCAQALADPLREPPRLHAVRVVSDRFRIADPRHRVERRRRLDVKNASRAPGAGS